MSLAAWLAGGRLRPMARTLAKQLALRTSPKQLDGASAWGTGVRSAEGPLLSIAGALLKGHHYPRTVWTSATRLPARSADRLYWNTASAQASSQIGMRLGMMRRRKGRGAGKDGPKEEYMRTGPGGRRNCKGETAKVGVAAFVVAASFAQTSTSAAATGERGRANDGVGVAGTLLPSRSAATPTLSGERPRQEVHPLGRGGMGVLDFMVSTISARTSMAVATTGPDSIGVADWRLLPGFAATSMLSRDMEGPLEEGVNGDGDGGRDGLGSVGSGSG